MCVTCGCNKLEDNHGNSKNITLSQFRDAAQASNIGLDKVLQNVNQGLRNETGKGMQRQ